MRTASCSTRAGIRIVQSAVAVAILMALLAAQVGVVAAAPPANDDIANATVIGSLPFTTTASTVEATPNPADPPASCIPGSGRTLWYRYDAPSSALLRVASGGFGSVVSYVGSPGDLTQVGCGSSPHLISVNAGMSYYFMVAAFSPMTVPLSVQVASPPANDLIEDATNISSLPFNTTASTVDATPSASDPPATCIGGSPGTVWLRYDASADGLLRLTSGSFGSVVSYSGSPGALTQVGCGGGTQLIAVTAGTTYFFMVASSLPVSIAFSLQVATPPANDLIENATLIGSLPFNAAQNTTDATPSATDPPASCFSGPRATVWLRYQAPSDELLRVAIGGGFGSFASYEGAPGALTEVGCGPTQLVPVTAGATYYFLVGSSFAAPIPFSVQLASPPANDLIENATAIGSLPFNTTQNTGDATHSASDPAATCISGAWATVWFRYTPETSGALRITADSAHRVIGYEGSPGSLSQVSCGGGGPQVVPVTAGTTYYIMLASPLTQPFTLTLDVQQASPPANDVIEHATTIGTLPFTASQSTTDATRGASDPFASCFGGSIATVWYRYDAPGTQQLRVTTTWSSGFGGATALYQGTPGSLTQVACSNQPGPQVVTVTGGHTYYFMLMSPFPMTVDFGVELLNTAPVVVVPDDITVEATGTAGSVVDFTASATDEQDTNVSVVCTPPSGSTFPIGVTTVQCTALDSAGLGSSADFAVTIVDTTPPILTVPERRTVDATHPGGAAVDLGVSASDIADANPTIDCNPPSGATFAIGNTPISCVATDASGNSSSGGFSVHVRGAREQIMKLQRAVKESTRGRLNEELSAELRDARDALERGKPSKACRSLSDFISTLLEKPGRTLDPVVAQQLVTDAARIKAVIDCR
jgi:hypothetical protein